MKIVKSKNKNKYSIELTRFELDCLALVAAYIGGLGHFREVFSDRPTSLLQQATDVTEENFLIKEKRLNISISSPIRVYDSAQILKLNQKRDRFGKFTKN